MKMIEIHRYSLINHDEIIEACFNDNEQGKTWIEYLNHVHPNNPYFKRNYWWGVPVYPENSSGGKT